MSKTEQITEPRGRHIPEPLINNMSTEELRSAIAGTPLSYMTLQAVSRRLLDIIDDLKR